MRARFMRGTSICLLAGVLLCPVAPLASAQEASAPPVESRAVEPEPSSGIDLALSLPAPPPAAVVLVDRNDVTGSIVDAGAPGRRSDVAMPPALPFDDQGIPLPARPAAARPGPAAILREPADRPVAIQATLLAPPMPPAAALSGAAQAGETLSGPVSTVSPAGVPPLDAQTISPAGPTPTAAAAQGLDGAALGRALAGFVADMPVGETAAQASERRRTRESIAAFYAARADAPLWIVEGGLTPAARSALARLDHAAEDGLDLRRFAVALPRSADVDVLARAELALSEAVVAYGRQASGSRVDVARLGGIIDERPDVATAERVLGAVPAASDAGEALRAFNPSQPGYAGLRQKLAELRQHNELEARSRIPFGPVLKPGMIDARVPLVRARIGLDVASADPGAPALVYDVRVAAAVADFQRTHGLMASGTLTPRTIAALSGGDPSRLENDILANMEIWRWMPRDFGPDYIEVNIPDYRVKVFRAGLMAHETRVVVGQPDKPTPVFSQTMKFIIVNPYWNVPLSIIKKEMLPKLASDPDYFTNRGYEVVQRDGVTYVRQPPGDGNALGRIKFMFPNSHSVYLHDTNARSAFGKDMRALSHGCVRVEMPFRFAEAVLGRQNGWTEARVKAMLGKTERAINLPQALPIHLVYFTAFIDPRAGLQLRDDVYGYEGRVKAALGLAG